MIAAVAIAATGIGSGRSTLCVLLAACVAGSSAFSPSSISLGPPRATFGGAIQIPVQSCDYRRGVSKSAGALHCVASASLVGSSIEESDVQLAPWRQNLDLKAWGADMRAIEQDALHNTGADDLKHLQKMRIWYSVMYFAGVSASGFCQLPCNPLSAILMSTAICMRWTMIGHHTCHGGYNALVNPDDRFHRSNFAKGAVRRALDWCDWMLPEAWDVEHNYMHHYVIPPCPLNIVP